MRKVNFFEYIAHFDKTSKSMKIAACSKIHFTHLQHDENHCVCFSKIGRHSEKSWQKRDHVCRA